MTVFFVKSNKKIPT